MIPVAEHAEAAEILFLAFDLLRSIGTTQPLRFTGGQMFAVLFLDLHFDRHAVAVPARHIRRIETRQRFRFDDDVLENFIYRMADVNITIGIRRAVVQHEARTAATRFTDALVETTLLPLGKHFRFAFRQIAAHREWRIREVQGAFVISHVCSVSETFQNFFKTAVSNQSAVQAACCEKNARVSATSRAICCFNVSRSTYFASSRNLCRKSTRTSSL